MRPGLAIFARTVGLSQVKTRLGAAVGSAFAEEFYSLSLEAVAEVVSATVGESSGAITPYWAVAEEAGIGAKRSAPFTAIWTGGGGGLGCRLNSVYRRLLKAHGSVMMIGSDSPGLTVALLKEAAQRLFAEPGSCVIGPCTDGGFYLFAASVPIPESLWNSVGYSTRSTLEELVCRLEGAGRTVRMTTELGDVDIVEDLQPLLESLGAMKGRLKKQERLYRWLQERREVFEPK